MIRPFIIFLFVTFAHDGISLLKNKAVTIYDIAKEAKVSVATVSRVLSNSDYPVNASTREKVKQIAADWHYTPNLLGKIFKKNEANDIGVIVPTIQNPFYTEVLIGIGAEVTKSGYDVLLYNSNRDVGTERRHIRKLCQKQVKGLIISSVDTDPETLTEFLKAGGTVLLFDQFKHIPGCINLTFDFIKASRMAVEYLIAMGHRNIAFLSSPLVIKSRSDNLEGYKQAHISHCIPVRQENIIVGNKEHEIEDGLYEFENGKELANLFCKLKNRPTAIFTVNDLTAFGVIQQLATLGIAVPKDVSVMGFDNISIAKMVNPPLTTVAQPSFETGKIAGRLLAAALAGDASESGTVTKLEPSVVIRDSVKDIHERQERVERV